MSELRERLFQLKLRKMNELAEIRPNFNPASFSEGFALACPILEELVSYVEKDAKAYAQTRYDSDLHLGGQSLAEDIMDNLNTWLDGSENG